MKVEEQYEAHEAYRKAYKEAEERLKRYEDLAREALKNCKAPESFIRDTSSIASTIEFYLKDNLKGKSHWGKHELAEFIPRVIMHAFSERLITIGSFIKFVPSEYKETINVNETIPSS